MAYEEVSSLTHLGLSMYKKVGFVYVRFLSVRSVFHQAFLLIAVKTSLSLSRL